MGLLDEVGEEVFSIIKQLSTFDALERVNAIMAFLVEQVHRGVHEGYLAGLADVIAGQLQCGRRRGFQVFVGLRF